MNHVALDSPQSVKGPVRDTPQIIYIYEETSLKDTAVSTFHYVWRLLRV